MRRWLTRTPVLLLLALLLLTACTPAAETGVEGDLNALTGSLSLIHI